MSLVVSVGALEERRSDRRARRSPFRFESTQQKPHQHSIKTSAAHLGDLFQRLIRSSRGGERLFGHHVGVRISKSNDASPERDLFASQPVWITRAIEVLMVMFDRFAHHGGV